MFNKSDKENAKRPKRKDKRERGFGSVDDEKQQEIVRKEGKAAHGKGTAQELPPKEASVAGRKSGQAKQQDKKGMGRETIVNAIEMLKTDHDKVKDLFREYETAGERAHQKKNDIAERIFMELDAHAKVEEEIFYPAVQTLGDRKLEGLINKSFKEHQEVKTLIEDLRGSYPASEYYDEKFKMLMENVEHHIEEEESEVFPSAEEKLGDEIERLGTEMRERKDQIMAVR